MRITNRTLLIVEVSNGVFHGVTYSEVRATLNKLFYQCLPAHAMFICDTVINRAPRRFRSNDIFSINTRSRHPSHKAGGSHASGRTKRVAKIPKTGQPTSRLLHLNNREDDRMSSGKPSAIWSCNTPPTPWETGRLSEYRTQYIGTVTAALPVNQRWLPVQHFCLACRRTCFI